MPLRELPHLRSLMQLHSAVVDAATQHFELLDLIEVPVPILVGATGSCENISTAFTLDADTYLAQTGQLALERALGVAGGVYCVTRSFRNDPVDARHLREFTLIEEETSWAQADSASSIDTYEPKAMFERLLDEIADVIRAMIRGAIDSDALVDFSSDVVALEHVLKTPFARLTYDETLELLSNSGEEVEWGSDLGARHEAKLLDIVRGDRGVATPTFITHFPKDIKFFNMRTSEEDPRVVLSVDLLLPFSGEAVGGAIREERPSVLAERFQTSEIFNALRQRGKDPMTEFEGYFAFVEESGQWSPHAGFGIGLERVLQFLVGCDDIRVVAAHDLLQAALRSSKA